VFNQQKILCSLQTQTYTYKQTDVHTKTISGDTSVMTKSNKCVSKMHIDKGGGCS